MNDDHGEVLTVGNVTVTAHGAFLHSGVQVKADTLLECEVGSLYAAEYVALEAVRIGQGGHRLVKLFCSPWLAPVGLARTESEPDFPHSAAAFH